MKNLFLFGAGASYGSGHIIPEQPPLLNTLFSELIRCYPKSWGKLPKELSDVFNQDFELGTAKIWDNYSTILPPLIQQMALYFVQFRPANVKENGYFKLLRFLMEREKVSSTILFTLNYEAVLDLCAHALNLRIDPENKTEDDKTIKIIKLHGACNIIPVGIKVSRSVKFTKGVLFGTGAKYLFNLNEVVEFCLGDNGLPPVMALIMKEKPVQVSQFILNRYKKIWHDILKEKNKIFVIGVNPNNEDKHLWNPLMTTPSKIYYVGGDWDRIGELQQKFLTTPRALGKKFHKCIDKIIEIVLED